MLVECSILTAIHLDPGYALLSVQNCLTFMEMFNIVDVHRTNKINDVQFMLLLKNITNASRTEAEEIFNLMDIDHSGEVDFEEFYLLCCILIACKDTYEKEFISRHCATIFQLIDTDASGEIGPEEFYRMGVMFNFDKAAISKIFYEFDISGDQNLDFTEFRLFTMACIDEARAAGIREKVKAFKKYRERLLTALEPTLRRFIRTDRLPRPRELETTVNHVRHPYIPGKVDFFRHFKYHVVSDTFKETREEIRDFFKDLCRKVPCLYCFFGLLLCCYFCSDNPCPKGQHGGFCRCKCKCHCLYCWMTYIRKLWTCCYCIFPCCHCCQDPNLIAMQHIGRRRKLKWPDMAKKKAEEKEKHDHEVEEMRKARHQAWMEEKERRKKSLMERQLQLQQQHHHHHQRKSEPKRKNVSLRRSRRPSEKISSFYFDDKVK